MNTRYELIIYWSKDDDSFVVDSAGTIHFSLITDHRPLLQSRRPIPEPRGPARREATNHIG